MSLLALKIWVGFLISWMGCVCGDRDCFVNLLRLSRILLRYDMS